MARFIPITSVLDYPNAMCVFLLTAHKNFCIVLIYNLEFMGEFDIVKTTYITCFSLCFHEKN